MELRVSDFAFWATQANTGVLPVWQIAWGDYLGETGLKEQNHLETAKAHVGVVGKEVKR